MTGNATLAAISFPDEFRATELLTALNRLTSEGHLLVNDAAFVVKEPEGKTYVQETTDLETSNATLGGGLWAGLFGLLLGGPVGFLVGGGLGAGAGALTAKLVDTGIPDGFLSQLRESVAPGTTTLALLLSHIDDEPLHKELQRFPGARLVAGDLPGPVLDALRAGAGT